MELQKRSLPVALTNIATAIGILAAMAAIWWLVTNIPIFGLLGSWLAFILLVLYYSGHLSERNGSE